MKYTGIRRTGRMAFILALCSMALILTGCFESKQDFTLNPDGSGKVVLDVLFDPSAVSMGQSSSDPQKEMEGAVRKIIQQAKGVETWKDVVFKRMPDGRVSFKGTAYFQDISRLEIDNYGTKFSLTREGNQLSLRMLEDEKEKKPAAPAAAPAGEPTEEEITAGIEKAKGEWERTKPMMMAMLSGLKKEATVRLPGKIVEVNNFTKVSDSVVKVSIDGAKMIEMLDAAMNDEEWLRQQAKAGTLESEGPPMDETMNEKYFGSPGPLTAKVQAGKPLFDYKKEAGAAAKLYPKLMESLGVVPKLPAGSVLKDGIKFAAGEIKDNRTTGQFFAGLTVELVITGDVLQRARSIRSLDVLKAVDDQGNDLIKPKEDSGSSGASMRLGGSSGGNEGELKQSLELKNPARAAATIQELSGEVQLYMPDKDPKSKVVIKNFMKQTGKPLVSDVLKKSKIEVAVLNREQFEAAKAAKEQAEQEGAAPAGKDPVSMLLKAFADTFSGYMSASDNDLVFMTKDPGGRVVELEVQDASGAPIPTQGYSGGSDMRVVSFEQLPPDTAQLVIYMETSASLVKAPFSLTGLTLP